MVKTETAANIGSLASAGKVAVLGIEGIRSRLGDRWGALSEKVHAYFSLLLEREMKPGDCFWKVDELSYLVLFRDLSIADAQLKCVALAEAASRRLFGEDIGAVAIRVVVAAIDGAHSLESLDPMARAEAALRDSGTEIVVEHSRGQAPTPKADPAIRPSQSSAHLRPVKIRIGSGIGHAETLIDKIVFRYRPIWDSTRKVVLTYLCQPMLPPGAGILAAPAVHGHWLSSDPEDALSLDLLVVQEVVKRMQVLRNEGFRIVAGCPVHFATISHSRSWAEYLRILESAGSESRRDIAFLLIGIDEGVPNVRLAQEIPKLSSYSKLVFAGVDYHPGVVSRLEGTGIHAIGMELRNVTGSERPLLSAIDGLARESENARVACFVLGAASKSTVISAIASGVRYLEGSAIAAPVAEPRHAFVREIADLYR